MTMLDYAKIAAFLAAERKALHLTQQEVAEKLSVSFQAVSKWENGTLPSLEILTELAELYQCSVDEMIQGRREVSEQFSYRKAGVDISYTDAMKREMAPYLRSEDPRVLNAMGAFASLYDASFPDMKHPVLVLKSEEPGSKQKLAMEYGYAESICHDMINHLVNDIAVMGARPLAVLDTIVCGNAEKETIKSFIKGMAEACRANGCSLVGGETSVQPQVVEKGTYILTASVVGIAEKEALIDGSAVREGDAVLALASNGLHTNGYSLVRMLMEKLPQCKLDKIEGETFIEQIMKPHTSYLAAIQAALAVGGVHAMAHITGGGIAGNLNRVIPKGLSAQVQVDAIRLLPVFSYLRRVAKVCDEEMLATFNCGVGLVMVVSPEAEQAIREAVSGYHTCYRIGTVRRGPEAVRYVGSLQE